jgi:hypothetical protein
MVQDSLANHTGPLFIHSKETASSSASQRLSYTILVTVMFFFLLGVSIFLEPDTMGRSTYFVSHPSPLSTYTLNFEYALLPLITEPLKV